MAVFAIVAGHGRLALSHGAGPGGRRTEGPMPSVSAVHRGACCAAGRVSGPRALKATVPTVLGRAGEGSGRAGRCWRKENPHDSGPHPRAGVKRLLLERITGTTARSPPPPPQRRKDGPPRSGEKLASGPAAAPPWGGPVLVDFLERDPPYMFRDWAWNTRCPGVARHGHQRVNGPHRTAGLAGERRPTAFLDPGRPGMSGAGVTGPPPPTPTTRAAKEEKTCGRPRRAAAGEAAVTAREKTGAGQRSSLSPVQPGPAVRTGLGTGTGPCSEPRCSGRLAMVLAGLNRDGSGEQQRSAVRGGAPVPWVRLIG